MVSSLNGRLISGGRKEAFQGALPSVKTCTQEALPGCRVVFFGSAVLGTRKEGSDADGVCFVSEVLVQEPRQEPERKVPSLKEAAIAVHRKGIQAQALGLELWEKMLQRFEGGHAWKWAALKQLGDIFVSKGHKVVRKPSALPPLLTVKMSTSESESAPDLEFDLAFGREEEDLAVR
uniref:Uncharacterized protein n=1 Tax=Chromera velia CCMP2878 TaxID=1169474 RepID=A0A0G4FB74_9ALVE|eukprot:Cvel_16025.t1-p1 / transcript=Cvel_16025.t1 / gene=Cvel_16025 / organism=Chromera_velia_CCMP2878 / gene_product=hypothetical protein / transcript_product=hypothetical protein / location=Cvel_scaffold1216:24714-25241(-) / protein_length=176 / sequence_SO=supercontig / SO=protein_coding / is_pseudo=false